MTESFRKSVAWLKHHVSSGEFQAQLLQSLNMSAGAWPVMSEFVALPKEESKLKALLVVAHPDDESECAAIVYRITHELGGIVDQLIVTDGEGGHRYSAPADAGIASHASGTWMSQVGRNTTDAVDSILTGKRFLIHDRDPLFTAQFQSILKSVGVACVKLPPRSHNLNAYAERFVRSIKESCLNRVRLVGEQSLRRAIPEFVTHSDQEGNHQGFSNRLIAPNSTLQTTGAICHRERLGGMLNYYYRSAA